MKKLENVKKALDKIFDESEEARPNAYNKIMDISTQALTDLKSYMEREKKRTDMLKMSEDNINGVSPMSKWMTPVGMETLENLNEWVKGQCRQIDHLRINLETRPKEDAEELHDYVLGKSSALGQFNLCIKRVMEREEDTQLCKKALSQILNKIGTIDEDAVDRPYRSIIYEVEQIGINYYNAQPPRRRNKPMIDNHGSFVDQVCEICWNEEASNDEVAQQVTDLVIMNYGGKPDE